MQLRHTDIKQKSLLATNIKVEQLLADTWGGGGGGGGGGDNLPPPPRRI